MLSVWEFVSQYVHALSDALSSSQRYTPVTPVLPLTRSIQSEHMRDTIIPSHLTWTHLAPQFELQVIEMQKEKAKKRPKVRKLDA